MIDHSLGEDDPVGDFLAVDGPLVMPKFHRPVADEGAKIQFSIPGVAAGVAGVKVAEVSVIQGSAVDVGVAPAGRSHEGIDGQLGPFIKGNQIFEMFGFVIRNIVMDVEPTGSVNLDIQLIQDPANGLDLV